MKKMAGTYVANTNKMQSGVKEQAPNRRASMRSIQLSISLSGHGVVDCGLPRLYIGRWTQKCLAMVGDRSCTQWPLAGVVGGCSGGGTPSEPGCKQTVVVQQKRQVKGATRSD